MATNTSPDSNTISTPSGLCLDGLTVTIGGPPLFHNLSHQFTGGQWTCLLGRSGVGKSMLLRAMMGLLDGPVNDHGAQNVSVEGTILTDTGATLDHNVAYMAQQDLLMPWLSVRENVLLGSRLRQDHHPDTDRADELLAKTGLLSRSGDLPAQLSGGMRQRVALARTLFEDKPFVLMDEPFSALDAITRLHAQDLAAELLVGRTVVMVTHDPLEAIRLAHNIHIVSGAPATLGEAIVPGGTAPRAVDNDAVLRLQGELLNALGGNAHGIDTGGL
jgi:putative hydroxymethylpyrimidine transport system ATP-binding protein